MSLRLMVYDRTCNGPLFLPGLTLTWRLGGWLYRRLGRLDACYGAASWAEALHWLATYQEGRSIQEIQFWGHGNWGCAKIASESLDVDILDPDDLRHDSLNIIRDRLSGDDALWWFRTCETFGRPVGHVFARRFADHMGATIAGHTYVIHWAQSGLHSVRPGQAPKWAADEGVRPDGASQGMWSTFRSPHTISCLHGRVPDGW